MGVDASVQGDPSLRTERHILEQAKHAAEEFSTFSSDEVQKIIEAVTEVAVEKARFFADWAVRETGYGVPADKEFKNIGASRTLVDFYKDRDFTGYEIDHDKKVVKIARPAGSVLALVPSTNPIATTYYKILLCLMTRNAVTISPHPAAKECCAAVADCLAEVAVKAGAPKNAIQVVREPSVPLVDWMMKSDLVSVILATGGPAMVRAAYSSGNPALGVGPGNVAHYVDSSADINAASKRIVDGASFDNNLPCTCESVILADRSIADELTALTVADGAHIIDGDNVARLRSWLYPDGKMNAEAIGKDATWIAQQAGLRVPATTRVLAVEIHEIDHAEEFSREKMFPVVGFMKVGGLPDALAAAQKMIDMGGLGHSAAIHSQNPDAIVAWGANLKVYRVSVNGVASLTSSGFTSGLPPTVTIGTGYFGRSSVGENVGPDHLIHWTHLAYNEDPAEVMGDVDGALGRWYQTLGSRQKYICQGPDVAGVADLDVQGLSSFIRTEIQKALSEMDSSVTPNFTTTLAASTGASEAEHELTSGLVNEATIESLSGQGVKRLLLAKQIVVTPLARDLARRMNITIERSIS